MNEVATVIIVVVGIVPVIIGSKAESDEHTPVKPVVKSTTVKVAADKTAMKCTAVDCSGSETAVTTATAVPATTAVTTAAAAAATAATRQRGGRLRQAQSCHRQQRNNRFPHHGSLLLLEDVAPKCITASLRDYSKTRR
jgi:hypothetical protein